MQPGDAWVGATVAGRFVVEGVAGAGGMGTVYAAIDREDGGRVALKVLTPRGRGDVERFLREATLLSELSHPNIVRYVAHGLDGEERPYLAMEWLDGEDLARRLSRGPLGADETRRLAEQLALALGAAHDRGVVHRDVKPSNVFLVGGSVSNVRMLDFGVARLSGASLVTATGVVVGTPAYMAPEQARGSRELGPAVDVFALGAVLFECLTGTPAFHGENVMAILARVLLEPPRSPGELAPVPADLDRAVRLMLAKDAGDRPADGRAAHELLIATAPSRASTPASREPSAPTSTFGRSEQEWVSLVFAHDPGHLDTAQARTLAVGELDTLARVVEKAKAQGARVSRLIDGTVLAQTSQAGSPRDRAAAAARCALAMHHELGADAHVCVVTGRGVRGQTPIGDVIDRAARLLSLPASRGGPRLDAATSGLLDAGFELSGDADSLTITGERTADEVPRLLLGRPAPFVGRDRELATVAGLVDECIEEGIARAVLLTAPAGAGKTRLRKELTARLFARADLPAPWLARGDAISAGSPHGMLVQLVRSAAGLREGEAAEVVRHKLVARVSQRVPAADVPRVAAFLGELVGAPFDASFASELEGARRDPMAMGDQIQAAWEDLVVAETDGAPCVLVLEDLHWGDRPTVRACDRVLRRVRDRALLVLATARPEVHQAFPSLWEGRDVHEVKLVPLSQKASERLIRSVLGDRASADVVSRVSSRAEGNAFLLEELVRAEAAGLGATAPETALAVTGARLATLPEEARRVLRAASIFGEVFWQGAVGELTTPEGLAHAIDTLVDAEIVERRATSRFEGERELMFRHALLCDAAYATLTPVDAQAGHAVAAAWLEARGERDPTRLAEHHERAGAAPSAARFHLRAAELALEGNDFAGTVHHAERAIALGDDTLDRALASALMADAHHWAGRYREAALAATDAMDRYPRGARGWYRAAMALVIARQRLGDYEHVCRFGEEVIEAPTDADAAAARVEVLARTGMRILYYLPSPLAESLFDAAERVPGGGDTALGAAWLELVAAGRAHHAGDLPVFLEHLERAAAGLFAAGNVRDAMNQWEDQGWWFTNIGEHELARRATSRVLAEAQKLGLRRVEIHARLAHCWELSQAASEEAITVGEAVLRDTEGTGDASSARFFLCFSLLRAGRVARAMEVLGDVPEASIPRSYLGMLYATLAEAHAVAGPDTARRYQDLALTALEVPMPPYQRAEALAALGTTCIATGRPDEARAFVREAVACLESHLGSFSSEAARHRALTHMHAAQRTVTLAEALGLRGPFAVSAP